MAVGWPERTGSPGHVFIVHLSLPVALGAGGMPASAWTCSLPLCLGPIERRSCLMPEMAPWPGFPRLCQPRPSLAPAAAGTGGGTAGCVRSAPPELGQGSDHGAIFTGMKGSESRPHLIHWPT